MYMNTSTIIRAWKDEAFRQSLTEAERALLPANPAGLLELTDEELAGVAGGGKRKSKSKSDSDGHRRRRRRRRRGNRTT
jgi:mersacidin/lichenicidin family type 2 lantibiotic